MAYVLSRDITFQEWYVRFTNNWNPEKQGLVPINSNIKGFFKLCLQSPLRAIKIPKDVYIVESFKPAIV